MLGNVTFHIGSGSMPGVQALTRPHMNAGLRATFSTTYSTSLYNDQQKKHHIYK